MKFIIGKKQGMTQKFTETGAHAVTVISADPFVVTQVKNDKRDGYTAVQVGFGSRKKPRSKPVAGHTKDLGNFEMLKEFRGEFAVERGQVGSVSNFQPGEKVAVTGISKGKGFQGVVKRHGFAGSLKTHGHKDQHRMPGSIGSGGVARVFKGLRMPGRMGGDQVTTKNIEIIEVDVDNNILYLKGAIPGAKNGFIWITADGEMQFMSKDELNKKADTPEEKTEEPKAEVAEEKVEEKVEEKIEEKKEEKSEEKKDEAPAQESKAEEKPVSSEATTDKK